MAERGNKKMQVSVRVIGLNPIVQQRTGTHKQIVLERFYPLLVYIYYI